MQEVSAAAPPAVSRASKPLAPEGSGGAPAQQGYQNVPVGGFGGSNAAPPPLAPRAGTTAGGGGAAASAAAAATVKAAAASAPRVINNPGYQATDAGLATQEWFAGALGRDAAKDAVMGHPDGTFLIRSSTRHDGYSLSVKFSETCRHVKVLKDGKGNFGFTEPCEYSSITAFVEHFQAVSLSVYNAELETKLEYPYKTAPAGNGAPASTTEDVDEELYASKREALRGKKGHYAKSSTYDTAYYSTEVNLIAKEKKAMDAVLTMYQEQIEILEKAEHKVTVDAEKAAIAANMSTIRQKKVDSERKLSKIIEQLEAARKSEDSSQRGGSMSMGQKGRGGGR